MSTKSSTDANPGYPTNGEPELPSPAVPVEGEPRLESEVVEVNRGIQPDDVPTRVRFTAYHWVQQYQHLLSHRIERQLAGLAIPRELYAREQPRAKSNDLGPYIYWDLLVLPPVQFCGMQPLRPQKALLADEWTLLPSILFINPVCAGGHLPATSVLGGRPLRIRYQHLDLARVRSGPDFIYEGQLATPAPVLTAFLVFHRFDPAATGSVVLDLTVTAELLGFGQPFVAFQTNHHDLDAEPGFLHSPPQVPQFRDQVPLRFMVCSKP